jgi:micrococcal nuclease
MGCNLTKSVEIIEPPLKAIFPKEEEKKVTFVDQVTSSNGVFQPTTSIEVELRQANMNSQVQPFDVNLDKHRGLVTKVIDGDTYDVLVKFKGDFSTFRIRLYGVDCPETRTRDLLEKKRGLASKDAVRDLLQDQFVTLIRPPGLKKDKYGRHLYLLQMDPDDEDVTTWIINNGYGQAYDGGTKSK